jgi:hypothetical protein
MDLIALDASAVPELAEGDWVTLDYDLPSAAQASGLSQYELLTGLSERLGAATGFSLRRRRLWRVGAQIRHGAVPAFGRPRLADVAPVQDQPVMRMGDKRFRDRLFKV